MSLSNMTFLRIFSPVRTQLRFGSNIRRGKDPDVARSLKQRLEPSIADEELVRRHDIGFPFEKLPRSAEFRQRYDHLKKQKTDPNIEKLARSNQLEINLSDVKNEWCKTSKPFHLRKIADHYGIFNDLFGKYAFFVPRVHMNIKYPLEEDSFCSIHYGNRIQPTQAKEIPEVSFEHKFALSYNDKPEENTLWTLTLTNPDGHLKEDNKEYVHWMVSNIPNGNLSKGDLIVPYLQPLPLKGTGYHRYVFLLYKQDKKLDMSNFKVSDIKDLDKRTFYTYDFYKNYQDFMTPAGLSFFQAKWDDSVHDVFHNLFNTKHPMFEYDFPEPFLKYQKQFPLREPFNLYLDRYADPKDVNKRFLERRLSKTHPFEGPEPALRFPNAHFIDQELPSWYKTELRKERLKRGRINDAK